MKKLFLFLNEFLHVGWTAAFLPSAIGWADILIRDIFKFTRIYKLFQSNKWIWLFFFHKSFLFILDHRSCLNQIISRLSFKTWVLLTTWTNFFLHLMCELIQLINKICLFEIINTYKIFLDLVQRPIPKLISNHTPLDAALASWFFLLRINFFWDCLEPSIVDVIEC